MPYLIILLLSLYLPQAQAHGVQHRLHSEQATVIQLSYDDGRPFAHQAYELRPLGAAADAAAATLRGQSDSAGRIVFLPQQSPQWQLRVFSEEGHGLVVPIQPLPDSNHGAEPQPVQAAQAAALASQDHHHDGPNTASLSLFGLSLLLAAFALYQLLLQNRRK